MLGEQESITSENEGVAANLFGGKMPIKAALHELRMRLLDLTGRNKLINFRHTAGKALQFVHTNMDAVLPRLLSDQNSKVTITPVPEPERREWENINGRLTVPSAKEYAQRVGIDPSYELLRPSGRQMAGSLSGSQARTLFYAEDLGKHCRKLERDAKLAIEETGANMLYLVMGFLEFPEAPESEKLYRAPLICVPVMMSKSEDEGKYTTFHLHYTGEEFAENLSLKEKIKRDFGLALPDFDPESGASVESYFDAITDATCAMPNWRVRRMMTLTLMSFSNMLLVRDLDPESWVDSQGESVLLNHPVVKQVFEGKPSTGAAQYAPEFDIDRHPKASIPLIYDADSSQHSALIDVLEGKSRVIEGPPGTGKSQTITNLIAAAMQSGKKVLFVAEKLAALEVVKSRLSQAGLENFVLELHSNKANKKKVLTELSKRHEMSAPDPRDLPSLIQRFEQKRQELQTYSDLMGTQAAGETELTLQQVMWRAERHRLKAGDCASSVSTLQYPSALRTSRAEFASLCDGLKSLGSQLLEAGSYGPQHPLWGFFPTEFRPQGDEAVSAIITSFTEKLDAFAKAASDTAAFLGGAHVSMSADSAEKLVNLLSEISPANSDELKLSALPKLFPPSDAHGVRTLAALSDLARRKAQLDELEIELERCLLTPLLKPDLAESARQFEKGLSDLGVTSLSTEQLLQRGVVLRAEEEEARKSVSFLREQRLLLGLSDSTEVASLKQSVNAVAILCNAPTEQLHLRHEGLRRPASAKVIERAIGELHAIQTHQSDLDARFYTDTLPSDDELQQAIASLREGDSWYRVFQGSWRKAVKLHKSLQKSKAKIPANQRLDDLELIQKQMLRRKAWLTDSDLLRAAGPHFQAEKTPWDALLACATWSDEASLALEKLDIPPSIVDVLTVDRSVIVKLINQAQAQQKATDVLERFSAIPSGLLGITRPELLVQWSAEDWQARFKAIGLAAETLRKTADLLSQFARPGVPSGDCLKAVIKFNDVPKLLDGIENHAESAALLANHFCGRSTDTEALLATHRYGAQIKNARLPASIEQVLISDRSLENHAELSVFVAAINQGWADVAEFSSTMGHFGAFDIGLWANASPGTTSEFSAAIAAKTQRALQHVRLLLPWAQYVGARKQLLSAGLGDFIEKLEKGSVTPEALADSFAYRFYASIAQVAFDKHPVLRQFSGIRHSALRHEFAELDRQIISIRGKKVASDCLASAKPLPGKNGVRVGDKSEMTLLELLFTQQRPRVTVREMLNRAGKSIQELKPCFMMGPQAVAQFLAPGHLHFDIVVMDEASQLRPEEAIGAIARGTQLVVVGDPKQLPPTSFFARTSANPNEEDEEMGPLATSDAESILDVCKGHFQPIRTLRWHYRSRHESLIAFSNHHFYRGELLVFPSPYPKSKSLGVRYHYVADGVYENNLNQIEARRVVDAVVDHIRHRPGDSLGVVTLNAKQKDLVSEILEDRLRTMPEAVMYRERWEREGMGLFVKNLENVQGDERDCILISTTFGKPRGVGVVRQNFGPISREGGWRRLNVLFTRARKSVAVFSSMRPEDIVSDNKTPEGTRALRNYLEYARTGVMPIERETNLPPDSDFEVSVIDVLRSKGFEVTPQLGVAGFRIDIGVKHPDHRSGYLAAIECDGASYHSGRSVRDRDRIRQEILEGLGWKGRIWRIWSTDWFRNPHSETTRLLAFLEKLRQAPIPAEYLLDEPVEVNEPIAPSDDLSTHGDSGVAAEPDTQGIFDDELTVDVGDLVSYALIDKPEDVIQVRITFKQTDLAAGLVSEATPLGEALMGATVGETVVLRVPGKVAQVFRVQGIKRKSAVEA